MMFSKILEIVRKSEDILYAEAYSELYQTIKHGGFCANIF